MFSSYINLCNPDSVKEVLSLKTKLQNDSDLAPHTTLKKSESQRHS